MECLTNFFGLSKSCGLPAPKSGLYIDMLEGISLKALSNVESGKYVTAQAMIDSKMILVAERLKADFAEFIFGDMVENSIDSIISTNFCDTYETGQVGSAGLKISKQPSKLTSLFIPRFYFKSHVAVTDLPITVSDNSNTQVYLVTANADEEVSVELNWYSSQEFVTIKFDDSTVGPSQELVSPYSCGISPFNSFWYNGCKTCCAGSSPNIKIEGIDYNGDLISNYRGIRADVNLICDTEKMVCLIAMPQRINLLYMLGIELLKEYGISDRLNFFNHHSLEWVNGKKSEWASRVNQSLFSNGKGIRNMLRQHEKKCFICNSGSYAYSTP